jgi:hypothetical protein
MTSEPSGPRTPDAVTGSTTAGSAGGVPQVADRRLTAGAWSSALSVTDFASCLAMGVEPVGYVQGYSVMQWSWYSRSVYGPFGFLPGADPSAYSENWRCPHGFVSGEHRAVGSNFEQTWVETSWSTGWSLAYERMVEEADTLGAHGVIGVVDDMHPMSGTGAVEFRIRGTAVTVPGTERPPVPFTTFLSGQRLGKLLEAGFVPVNVAAAMSSVCMIGYCITHYQMSGTTAGVWSGSMSGGVPGVHSITQVNRAQQAARRLAREHVRHQLGTDTLHGAVLEQFDHEIGEGDLAIQCLLKGNRVRRFGDYQPLPEPDAVVRLR